MARKKVKLEYIQNEYARKVTYKKRVKGVLKKTKELSVLCAVDACTIIYGPYDQTPVFWPPVEAEAKRILSEYLRLPGYDQRERTLDQQAYMRLSVAKAHVTLRKLMCKRRDMEMENLMADLLNGKPLEQVAHKDLDDLQRVVNDKIRCVQHRLRVLERENNNQNNDNINKNNNNNTDIPYLPIDDGSNVIVNPPANQNPRNEMVIRGPPNKEASFSDWLNDNN